MSTHGTNWTRKADWMTTVDCFEWEGVTCDAEGGGRFVMQLQANGLAGPLPAGLFQVLGDEFPAGWEVTLYENFQLSGALPVEAVDAMLKTGYCVLDVDQTNVGGTIPDALGHVQNAVVFASDCAISGTIPEGFGVNMTDVALFFHDVIVSGTLPSSIVQAKRTAIDFQRSHVSGSLPDAVGDMLQGTLLLSQTLLEGTLPASVGRMRDGTLSIPRTLVSGALPTFTSDFFNTEFVASETLLAGEVPEALLSNMSYVGLTLDRTAIGGTLPSTMRVDVGGLVLSSTKISGEFPRRLDLESNFVITLESNALSGSLPVDADLHVSSGIILTIDVSDTFVGGTVSPNFASAGLLSLVATASNLEGTIPPTIPFHELKASSTFLSGTLPASLRLCVALEVASTAVSGAPPSILDFYFASSVTGFTPYTYDIKSSKMQGPLPDSLLAGYVVDLPARAAGLVGTIPRTARYGDAPGLESLVLSSNALVGSIPRELCTHSNLRVLDVSHNAGISGLVPSCLLPSLERLDVQGTRINVLSVEFVEAGSPLKALSIANSDIVISVSHCVALTELSRIRSMDMSNATLTVMTTLGQVSQCLLERAPLAQLLLNDIQFETESCVVPGLSGRECNRLQGSPYLEVLELRNTNLKTLRLRLDNAFSEFLPDDDRELRRSDLPSLTTLVISDNPGLQGRVPAFFGELLEVDISRTHYDLCASRPVFTSSSLRRLSFFGLEAPFEQCAHLVLPEATAPLVASDTSVVTDPARGLLRCPQWTLRDSINGGVLEYDTTFLSFYRCQCPDQHYFGRALDTEVSGIASWGTYAPDSVLFDAAMFQCRECPHAARLECHGGTEPEPDHKLVGSLYPVYSFDDGAWRFMPERWRLPHAALLTCQHPHVCNAKLDSSESVQCRDGHDPNSLLCSRCEGGYYMIGLLCRKCFAGAQGVVPVVFILAVAAYAGFLFKRALNQPGMTVSTWFFWLQLDGIIVRINQQLEAGAGATGTRASDGGFFAPVQDALATIAAFRPFALECVNSSITFFDQTMFVLVMPAVVGVLGLVLFVASRVYLQGCVATLVDMLRPSVFVTDWKNRGARMEQALMFTWSLMIFPISHRVFQTFSCQDGDVAGDRQADVRFLSAAPWIECGSGEHVGMIVLSVLVFVGFVVPLIAFMWIRLKQRHVEAKFRRTVARSSRVSLEMTVAELRELEEDSSSGTAEAAEQEGGGGDESESVHALSFMTASVRPEVWWWPVLVRQTRALSLALIVATVPFSNVFLPMSVFAILLVALLVHVKVQPYRSRQDNLLEMMVLVAALLRYMLSLLSALSSSSAESVRSVSTFESLISLLVFFVVAWLLSGKARAWVGSRLKL